MLTLTNNVIQIDSKTLEELLNVKQLRDCLIKQYIIKNNDTHKNILFKEYPLMGIYFLEEKEEIIINNGNIRKKLRKEEIKFIKEKIIV